MARVRLLEAAARLNVDQPRAFPSALALTALAQRRRPLPLVGCGAEGVGRVCDVIAPCLSQRHHPPDQRTEITSDPVVDTVLRVLFHLFIIGTKTIVLHAFHVVFTINFGKIYMVEINIVFHR